MVGLEHGIDPGSGSCPDPVSYPTLGPLLILIQIAPVSDLIAGSSEYLHCGPGPDPDPYAGIGSGPNLGFAPRSRPVGLLDLLVTMISLGEAKFKVASVS